MLKGMLPTVRRVKVDHGADLYRADIQTTDASSRIPEANDPFLGRVGYTREVYRKGTLAKAGTEGFDTANPTIFGRAAVFGHPRKTRLQELASPVRFYTAFASKNQGGAARQCDCCTSKPWQPPPIGRLSERGI